MLLALNDQEAQGLLERAAMLQENGIRAKYYPREAVEQLEPALTLPQAGGALLVESDSQLVRLCTHTHMHTLPLRLHLPACTRQRCTASSAW